MILITLGICGDTNGNNNYLSIEVCQSMGDIDIFKSKEEKALQLAAQKCKQYGIEQNQSTIRLHQEMYATSCPHRSVEIHGGASRCNWKDPKMVRMVTQDALVFQWIDSSCSNKKSPVEIPGRILYHLIKFRVAWRVAYRSKIRIFILISLNRF